ncbi:hypothetical protein CYMTET_16928 [Cymbomonas tetramitiformis]|uniref:DNA2/NAM7 helicase-like C-terminal domain-containing protein n=1 Tax=Cymbomonas tetramitiformis TaxID=36881 RepID=A0AAE0GBL3_9CHLO|nr:hypothetical protein CYMTET_16928 [Cymbomonas tetramitiformis]
MTRVRICSRRLPSTIRGVMTRVRICSRCLPSAIRRHDEVASARVVCPRPSSVIVAEIRHLLALSTLDHQRHDEVLICWRCLPSTIRRHSQSHLLCVVPPSPTIRRHAGGLICYALSLSTVGVAAKSRICSRCPPSTHPGVMAGLIYRALSALDHPASQRDVDNDEDDNQGKSFRNKGQAQVVAEVVQGLVRAGDVSKHAIGVITPYMGQKQELQHALQQHRLDVSVDTVDGYQGMEREVIVVSTVRGNTYGGVGFLKDERRMNVLLTRARRGLIVVGKASTLKRNPMWRAWVHWIQRSQLQLSEEGSNRFRHSQHYEDSQDMTKGRRRWASSC